jgi:hypothetical protein
VVGRAGKAWAGLKIQFAPDVDFMGMGMPFWAARQPAGQPTLANQRQFSKRVGDLLIQLCAKRQLYAKRVLHICEFWHPDIHPARPVDTIGQ